MHLYFHAIATLFLFFSLASLFHLRHARRLPPLGTSPIEPRYGVTVIIAARNEADRIRQTLTRILAQRGIDLQVIVVNDRSVDDTRQVVESIAGLDQRVKAVTVSELPEGWLGKCHACHIGSKLAEKPWILFTDADCWLKSDTLIRAIRQAEINGVDHVTLTPGVEPETIPARAWHIAFLITLSNCFSGTNLNKAGAHFGIGAFNLMRRDAYLKIGGHEKLRLTIVDDFKLGKLLHLAGYKTRAFIGGDDVECHWGKRAREMLKLMEKNYYAASDFNTAGVWGIVIFTSATYGGAMIGLISGRSDGL
ncbi:MAG: pgaC 2 [Verrucomicrobiales bacterium]|nr:pgaC 2 [Verrucomicrobiales bacterium]